MLRKRHYIKFNMLRLNVEIVPSIFMQARRKVKSAEDRRALAHSSQAALISAQTLPVRSLFFRHTPGFEKEQATKVVIQKSIKLHDTTEGTNKTNTILIPLSLPYQIYLQKFCPPLRSRTWENDPVRPLVLYVEVACVLRSTTAVWCQPPHHAPKERKFNLRPNHLYKSSELTFEDGVCNSLWMDWSTVHHEM